MRLGLGLEASGHPIAPLQPTPLQLPNEYLYVGQGLEFLFQALRQHSKCLFYRMSCQKILGPSLKS